MTQHQRVSSLRRVAICGGTHGNEMSGVYLVQHWLQDPSELRRSSFHATPFLGNLRAIERCVRYIGGDLNRTFSADFLNCKDLSIYEVQRAQEINQAFGPRGSPQAYDFMFDLHNTTANMGTSFILGSEPSLLSLHMCNYIQKHHPATSCRIILCLPGEETNFLTSVAKAGLGLEMGPQPQGVARADVLLQMRSIMACALDFIDLFNKGTLFPAFEFEAYRVLGKVDFPRYPNGEISAVVHSALQGSHIEKWTRKPQNCWAYMAISAGYLVVQDKDFQPLKPGDPIFQTLSGDDILYEDANIIYPIFINEAAYYEKKTAFIKTKKCTLSEPALQKL